MCPAEGLRPATPRQPPSAPAAADANLAGRRARHLRVGDEAIAAAAACSRPCARGTSSSHLGLGGLLPSCSTTTASTASPHLASGTPITATSLTGGCAPSTRLHLGRVDVLAAADDHVALAIHEVDVAVGVAPCHVAHRAPLAAESVGRAAFRAPLVDHPAPPGPGAEASRSVRVLPVAVEDVGVREYSSPTSPSGTSWPSGSRMRIAPEPAHSRPTEPRRSICSSGRSSVTQPASLDPYSSKAGRLKCARIASLVSLRAGADEISSFSTAPTS